MTGIPRVTLYGKPGCSPCSEVREALLAMRRDPRTFELIEVDVSTDPALHRRYGELIPVVSLDGETVSELVFDPDDLLTRLDRVEA